VTESCAAGPALIPLDELGTGSYKGAQGGLYPDGNNLRPPAHDAAGISLARGVRPLDARGAFDADGRIVLLSIGMSNTSAEFRTFKRLVRSDPRRNPALVFVDGAQRGASASCIAGDGGRASLRYWREVDRRLRAGRVTSSQVQVAWLKTADSHPAAPFPDHALELKRRLEQIAQILADRFPSLRLAYCSSRIYAGYATDSLSPEPFAYESGFAVKWLIEDQINGAPGLRFDTAAPARRAPWLAWGPYLWANGMAARSDGLSYALSDLASDGTHPGPGACRKVARQLNGFLGNDVTARGWFLRPGALTTSPGSDPPGA
jgi:hypothetical protein